MPPDDHHSFGPSGATKQLTIGLVNSLMRRSTPLVAQKYPFAG